MSYEHITCSVSLRYVQDACPSAGSSSSPPSLQTRGLWHTAAKLIRIEPHPILLTSVTTPLVIGMQSSDM